MLNDKSITTVQALRPLLPAPAGVRRTVPERAKKSHVIEACKLCRQRKSKCDGQRPRCGKCIASASECVYTPTAARNIRQRYSQLQAQRNVYEELVNLLRDIPEWDSFDVLRRIRAGGDAHDILRHVQGGGLLMQLCVVPETRHRYEFPYRSVMPATLQVPNNHALHSKLYAALQALENLSSAGNDMALYPSPYAKPLHAAEMIDSLLASTIPSMWTKVSSDDVLLRNLLGAFFVYEYPWMTAFHKDYFLEDMANGETNFCSTLLVNAILAKACTTFPGIKDRFMFWDPQNLGYRFLAEARRLWEMVATKASLTTIQAGYLITAIYNVNGLDKIGRSYTIQVIPMAEQLGLFHDDVNEDKRFRNAKAITGWSLFSWQLILCYYDFRPPYVTDPPTCSLPDPNQDPKWYPEVWLRYSTDPKLYPVHVGHSFKATCELYMILNDLASKTFRLSGKPRRLTWDEISSYQQELHVWYKRLPDVISLHAMVFPVHFQIHCLYHMVLVMLFDIERDMIYDRNPCFTDDQRNVATAVIAQADVQLETILRLYYARHSFQGYDSQLMMQLAYLGNVTLKRQSYVDDGSDTDSREELEATRSTFALVLKGLYEQSQNYHVSFSALQIMKGRISAHDQDLLGQLVASEATKHGEIPLDTSSTTAQWVFPLGTWKDNPDAARLEVLVNTERRCESPRQ